MNENRSEFLKGVLIALAGAICFSTKAIFVKLAYRDTSVDAVTLLTLRMVFSLPFFILAAGITSQKAGNIKFTGKQWMQVAVVGCFGYYISSYLDFKGLEYISAGIERLVLFMYPTLVLIISAIVFKTKIKSAQAIALVLTYIGLFIAFAGEAQVSNHIDFNFIKGSAFIFICAVTYALYIVGSGRLIPVVGATKFNSYAMTFASLGVFAHFIIWGKGSLFQQPSLVYVYSFLMAIISTVIPSYLVTQGIKRIGSGNAAIVASVGPISTILMAYLLLHESVSILQIAGTACIIMGVLLISGKGDQKESF